MRYHNVVIYLQFSVVRQDSPDCISIFDFLRFCQYSISKKRFNLYRVDPVHPVKIFPTNCSFLSTLLPLTVRIRHDVIRRDDDGDKVGDGGIDDHQGHRLEMGEIWGADAHAIGHVEAIAHDVVALFSPGDFRGEVRLSPGDFRSS